MEGGYQTPRPFRLIQNRLHALPTSAAGRFSRTPAPRNVWNPISFYIL